MRLEHIFALALVAGGAACSDATSDALVGSRYGGGGSSGGASVGGIGTSSSGGGTGSSGAGSSSGGTAGADGGTSLPTSSDGGLILVTSDGGLTARAAFEALLPTFDTACGGACHVMGGSNAPAYLGGADPYSTIKTYMGMITGTPATSILMTKGVHEGPAIADPLKTSVTQWLTLEAATLAASGPPETAPLTLTMGANTVDLTSVGLAGAKLTFTAAVTTNILTLSTVTLVTPATTGVHIAYPIFYADATGGAQTENDDFSNVDETVAAGSSSAVGTGLLILSGWATGDTLQIAFTKLEPATVADAGAPGGCKSVATFTADAVPAIQANQCLTCHDTGGSGNASLDLSGLAATPVNDTVACAQALTRIDTTTPAQSDIILAPTGQVTNHPFKTASASFTTMMETWISAEK